MRLGGFRGALCKTAYKLMELEVFTDAGIPVVSFPYYVLIDFAAFFFSHLFDKD